MHRREALSLSLRQNSIVRVCGSTIRTRNPKLRIIFLWKLIWTVPKIWITRQRNAIDTKSSAPSNLNLLTQNPTEWATALFFVNSEEEQILPLRFFSLVHQSGTPNILFQVFVYPIVGRVSWPFGDLWWNSRCCKMSVRLSLLDELFGYMTQASTCSKWWPPQPSPRAKRGTRFRSWFLRRTPFRLASY
jgi:hypothetical protein